MRTRETFGALQRAISTNQLLTVTLVSIVAVVVLLTSILGHETSRRDRSSAFDRIADQVTERLAKQAPLWMSYARANRDLIALNASPNPVDLLAYEEQLKERFSSVLSATFVPRITDDDRLAHELTMRRQGVSDYEIRDLNANMEFSRATQRLEYFPTYSHGLEGWDIGADPSLAPIIISVQESGEGLARMFAHPLGTNSGIGLVVFSPIYGGQSIPESLEERRREFSGISIISLDTSILIASVIGDLEDEVTVRVMIEQSQPSGLTDHALYISPEFDSTRDPSRDESIVIFADTWNLQIRVSDGLRGSWPSWVYPSVAATTGLAALMTGLLILILVQRQKDAVEISRELREMGEAKDRFLGTITHELKTPLTSVQAFTDILRSNRSKHLDEKEMEQLDLISRNSARLNVLIDDVLDVSRLHAGTFRLDPQEFEVEDFLSEIEHSLEPILSSKNQSLNVDIGFSGMCISADRNRIAQVLSNLMSNASKYSAPGSEIRLIASEYKGQLELGVMDAGVGILESDLVQIGTPFFRVDSVLSRKVGGTGLGIYVSKSIIELHGGTFEMTSEPDIGTSVTLRIPGLHIWHPPTSSLVERKYRSRFDDLLDSET